MPVTSRQLEGNSILAAILDIWWFKEKQSPGFWDLYRKSFAHTLAQSSVFSHRFTGDARPLSSSRFLACLQEIAFPKMVASCCRFLCYFCRISRQNQKAMFDHLSYLLENSSVGLGEYWGALLPRRSHFCLFSSSFCWVDNFLFCPSSWCLVFRGFSAPWENVETLVLEGER